MHQNRHEIMVLKPTAVFYSFLASQIPEGKLPDLRLLNIDNTAYVMQKQTSEEATLNEIEKHFPKMFHHEVCRWLGDKSCNEIENNFLDFLCCFKFAMHNHIILMEPSIEKSHQLLLIKPRTSLLNWIKKMADQEDLAEVVEHVELAHLEENATALIKNFSNLMEIKPFIKNCYQSLFSLAMSRMTTQANQWPKINSFEVFKRYFTIEIHTQLIYLS